MMAASPRGDDGRRRGTDGTQSSAVEPISARGSRDGTRLTSSGLQIPAGTGYEAWLAVGERIAGIATASAWCLGDWVVYGERAFGERYKAALTATALDYQTLRNYAWVARRVQMSRRRDTLSFQHHAEVAGLPPADQDLWLLRAERSGWSRNELRRRLRAARRGEDRVHLEPAVRLSVEVTRTREQRWREAAKAAELSLTEWMAAAGDAAADRVLMDPAAPAEGTSRTSLTVAR